jgi:hypothetical protein
MKVNSTFFYSLFALSISQLTMSADVFAKKQAADERWFEIEVILFQQLGDKTEFKEQFPEGINATNLPNYQKSFDLLNAYIKPDLTNIKQFLPQCTSDIKTDEKPLLLRSLNNISPAFNHRLQKIGQIAVFSSPEFNKEKNATILDLQKDKLAQPLFNTDIICAISQQDLENLFDKEQLASININSIDVAALPNKLNALGIHSENDPYLIADKSLLLNDISQRLRWSKEFKPLLHFGWRQVGVTQNSAIPLKLIAGQHLTYEYQKALADYQIKEETVKSLAPHLLGQLVTKAQNTAQMISPTDLNQSNSTLYMDDQINIPVENKQQQLLDQLFNRLDYLKNSPIDEDMITKTVNQINEQNLNEILEVASIGSNEKAQHLRVHTLPSAPLQPWFLDGFIKVHLDHYLYITADFNVFSQNNVKTIIENDKKNAVKLINFNQNRRVITGEIHYFDHPYIGMIVQIRRFDPTKPEGEQVSQSIK